MWKQILVAVIRAVAYVVLGVSIPTDSKLPVPPESEVLP